MNMPSKSKNIKITDQDKAYNKRRQLFKTPIHVRALGRKFLIVCEGQTEKHYFDQFPILTATIVSVGVGMTKSALIKEARRRQQADNFDEVWCVFDMDFNPERNGQLEDFNNAVFADNGANFRCAYSNDAFELWFCLHYQNVEIQCFRDRKSVV